MGRACRIAIGFCLLVVLAGCGQSGGTASGTGAQRVDKNVAYAILADTPLWDISADKKLTWKASLQLGEKVQLLGQTMQATQNDRAQDFVKVKRAKGDDGWAPLELVIPQSIPGVVVADRSVVYTDSANTAASGATLPRMSVVAVIGGKAAGQPFTKFTAWDAASRAYHKEQYLRSEDVSTSEADVQSAILLQLAAASKDPVQKEAFLKAAAKDYTGSVFAGVVADTLAAMQGKPAGSTVASESASGTRTASADNVNVRSSPDTTSSVVGTLSSGTRVRVLDRTVDESTIDGRTERWYRIEEPAGWVFGGYLSEP
jgi:hypothetical protein